MYSLSVACHDPAELGRIPLSAPDLTEVPPLQLITLTGKIAAVTGAGNGGGAVLQQAERDLGRIDILVDNAGADGGPSAPGRWQPVPTARPY